MRELPHIIQLKPLEGTSKDFVHVAYQPVTGRPNLNGGWAYTNKNLLGGEPISLYVYIF